jgi:hypothetical protein
MPLLELIVRNITRYPQPLPRRQSTTNPLTLFITLLIPHGAVFFLTNAQWALFEIRQVCGDIDRVQW